MRSKSMKLDLIFRTREFSNLRDSGFVIDGLRLTELLEIKCVVSPGWKLQKYLYYFDLGKPVFSPEYYTHSYKRISRCTEDVLKWQGKRTYRVKFRTSSCK